MRDYELIQNMFRNIGIELLTKETGCEIRDSEIPENTLFIPEGDKKAYYGTIFYFNEEGSLIDFKATY